MTQKNSSTQTVGWWIGWITLTIASFFLASSIWTPLIAKWVGPMSHPKAPIWWVVAVFGTWMIILVPLIVVMYAKVDKAYEDARLSREQRQISQDIAQSGVRCLDIDEDLRTLPDALRRQLKHIPYTLKSGHLVDAVLDDGRVVPNVFIYNRKIIAGLYDAERYDFSAGQIREFRPVDLDRLPPLKEERWLRLDGVGVPIYNKTP